MLTAILQERRYLINLLKVFVAPDKPTLGDILKGRFPYNKPLFPTREFVSLEDSRKRRSISMHGLSEFTRMVRKRDELRLAHEESDDDDRADIDSTSSAKSKQQKLRHVVASHFAINRVVHNKFPHSH